MLILFYLSSGLFLGWSLGANDAANVFGTAVGTRMIRFRTAAVICSLFVVLGAVMSGEGATRTLGKLGAVNAIAGSFMVALGAALTIFWMTRWKLPVSTSQAVVGGIVGWNFFSGTMTDYNSLTRIVLTWVVCPFLSAIFAMSVYKLLQAFTQKVKFHLLEVDMYTRVGLVIVGAFGSFSLGANNIANVVGMFVPVMPFDELNVYDLFVLSGTQQLFLLGGIAIAVGVFTYSYKVMETVGGALLRLSPESALVVVLAQALVLFIFASEQLESWLIQMGLPTIPLVPVSSSQAVIGAVIGIGFIRGGGREINFKVLTDIVLGWVTTPLIAGVITFVALFFLQNVFGQQVSKKITYMVTEPVIHNLVDKDFPVNEILQFKDTPYPSSIAFDAAMREKSDLNADQRAMVINISRQEKFVINPYIITKLDQEWLSTNQIEAVKALSNQTFQYDWQLINQLEKASDSWSLKPDTKNYKRYNKDIMHKRQYILDMFHVQSQ